MILERLLLLLEIYPERVKASLLREGFKVGFHVPEFLGPGCYMVDNSKSVTLNKEIVRQKIYAELSEGRIAGPFQFPPFHNFRISPLSIVPKKEPNSYRLIHNLSFPKKFSLNDVTDKSNAAVQYASFDDALALLRRFGRNALMAKADIKSAFRLLPICPSGFNSLGFHFDGQFFFDKCLPMGYTLSCFYFESFTTFLNWVVDREIVNVGSLHYLDDFFVGSTGTEDCLNALNNYIKTADYLGIPLAADKTVYPTDCLEFLGIVINSKTMEFYLPMQKIDKIKSIIKNFLHVNKITLRELQSLLGLLVFASKVIPMGRVFCKRLYRATCGFKSPFCHIRLNIQIKEDLLVWLKFLDHFNGRCIWQDEFVSSVALDLFTDAAGAIGYGAYFNGRWSAEKWPDLWFQYGFHKNIVLLELFPVLVAVIIWGPIFANKRILLHSDNKGVVFAINCLSSKSDPVVTRLRHLVLYCLKFNIWLKASYIEGEKNCLADALSRLQMVRFRDLAPDAEPVGTPCPPQLWDLLIH